MYAKFSGVHKIETFCLWLNPTWLRIDWVVHYLGYRASLDQALRSALI